MSVSASPVVFPQLRKAREFLAWLAVSAGVEMGRHYGGVARVRAKRAAWLVLRHWGLTLTEIGRLTTYDHPTVLHGIEAGKRQRDVLLLADQWLEAFEATRLTAPPQQTLLVHESVATVSPQRTTPPGARRP